MEPGIIKDANDSLGPPKKWAEEHEGDCGHLPIRRDFEDNAHRMLSAWFPSEEEKALIAAGSPVILRVVGVSHPPVWLYADPDIAHYVS